jgi:hypothetical protein
MRNLTIILFFVSFLSYAGGVVVVSNTRANKLKKNEVTDDLRFNPVLDSLGRWVVSEEEVDVLTDSDFIYLKKMPVIRYMKPKDTVDILGSKL